MASVRIVSAPPGDAPEEVRRAWVGLVVPLPRGSSGPRSVHTVGVLTGPHTWYRQLWAVITGRAEKMRGFVLDARQCFDLLDAHDPVAAEWWRKNTPHLLRPGQTLLFPSVTCELLVEPGQDVEDPVPVFAALGSLLTFIVGWIWFGAAFTATEPAWWNSMWTISAIFAISSLLAWRGASTSGGRAMLVLSVGTATMLLVAFGQG